MRNSLHGFPHAVKDLQFVKGSCPHIFPFDAEIHWPQETAGQKTETYHEWMKAVVLVSTSGCPALAGPAGFGGERNLPMGIQIIASNHRELDCLRLSYA